MFCLYHTEKSYTGNKTRITGKRLSSAEGTGMNFILTVTGKLDAVIVQAGQFKKGVKSLHRNSSGEEKWI